MPSTWSRGETSSTLTGWMNASRLAAKILEGKNDKEKTRARVHCL